jgi:hypothetical protein
MQIIFDYQYIYKKNKTMNSYFFKMTNEERNNILDQHKELYNGFATNNVSPNQQPLYVQDFANDKGGITVSNKGNVMTYKNMNINEDVYSGSAGSGMMEPEETFEEEEYMSLGEKLDMIGDGPLDLPNGTVDVDDSESETMFLIEPEEEEYMDYDDDEDFEFSIDKLMDLGYQEEQIEESEIVNKINESLDMFKRFKKYN